MSKPTSTRNRTGVVTCHPGRKYRSKGLCASCYKKSWRAANPDKVAAMNAKHRENRDPVADYEAAKAWRRTNPEKWRAIALAAYHRNPAGQRARSKARAEKIPLSQSAADARKRYADNPTAQRERSRKWIAKQVNYGKLMYQRRRARLQDGCSPGVRPVEWSEIIEVFSGRCAYCLGEGATIDHVEPLARGGRDEPSNVVPACAQCNSSKGSRTLLRWLLIGGPPALRAATMGDA